MRVDQNVSNSRSFAIGEPDFQQRDALNWQQAFRRTISQRTQTRAASGRQNKGFHEVIVTESHTS
jgi:D-aminopeptidase